MDNKPYLLALNRIPSIGSRTITKLLARWPVLAELFQLPQHALREVGLSEEVALAIRSFNMAGVEADLRWEQVKDHHLLTWEDIAYPQLLKEIADPPPVIYGVGDLACLQHPTLAIVGTRKPSVMGKETAWHFAHELSASGITIVSGLALGIDACAHEGCLAAQGKTIAVMGSGIDKIYPAVHGKLAEEIKATGLLITEFPLKTPPSAGHFPRRNRIISGLSLAILVIEAAKKSGSLITAKYALEQNRDVLAVPGSIHNPQTSGCHYLLQQGAKLVTSSREVVEEMFLENKIAITSVPTQIVATDNKDLLACIGFETTTIEQMMKRSGWQVEEVVCCLAELELQGSVLAVPGGYTRCL